MSQTDISVQPRETAVTAALRRLAGAAGWCVTHTTDGAHSPTSLHYVGRAVDLADRAGPGVDTPQLAAIAAAVEALVPLPLISELIWAGPGARYVKNGAHVDGLEVYGPATLAEHHNHVHLAVVAGFTFSGPQEAPMAATVSVVAAFPYEAGYVLVLSTGAVYAFNCTYRGGLSIATDGSVLANLPK